MKPLKNKKWAGLQAIFTVLTITLSCSLLYGSPDSELAAKKLFSRLTGTPLSRRDIRLQQMAALLDKGQDAEAAKIAMDDEHFYAVTVKQWASLMSNKEESPYVPFDDFQALIIGVTRDDLDARLLLTGDFTYSRKGLYSYSNPGSFDLKAFESGALSYKKDLTKVPQYGVNDPAGLLTTKAWAKAHYVAGTNRRAVQYAFQEFLCRPIDSWKTPGLDDRFVRRDVDRQPGKNPRTYQVQCRSCHAPMDAMAGAFSKMDYVDGAMVQSGDVVGKYNQNTGVYASGNITLDNAWINLLAENKEFGWHGETQGEGVKAFGEMLANSDAFKTCMVKRVFTTLCKRDPTPQDDPSIKVISQKFGNEGYKMKQIFGDVVLLPACIGNVD